MNHPIVEPLLNLLARRDYVPMDAAELARDLRVPPSSQTEFNRVLRELESSGRIARIKGHRYMQSQEADLIPGRIRMNRQGKGFLQPDDTGMKEIVVPESATGTALHEDRVLVRRDVRPRGLVPGGPDVQTGTVVRILERRRTRLVGTLQRSRQFLYVIPDDPRIPHDIYVPEPRDVGRAVNVGDKVVVELREWGSRHTNPEGEVVELLGAPDEEGVDMLSVLRQYNLPLKFPQAVLQEARARGTTVAEAELRDRVDCRRHLVVTIDPDDAKDFDDAICLDRAGSDRWRLWVHIADVSHYVRPGSALDLEARKRGNSTYLVDRVIPMLPEALSNELCSLKPGVDRLTKCVEFLLANDGRVLETKFYPAVIHSQRRYSYQEALAVLRGSPVGPVEHMLHEVHQLAQRIRRERFRAGSLELDFPEMKIRLDERGRIARIERHENDESHQLIEECMLLANEAVAARLMKLGRPSVYRVHEEPDEHRLREYREDVLSHQVPCGNLRQRVEVQRLLRRLSTLAIGPALKIGFLKSLLRARYSTEPLGHYGLAKAAYTHFTSPIRRYADLVVHRSLFDAQPLSTSSLREAADHISTTERNSADAERDSKDVKLFAFLEGQLKSRRPQVYDALVTDVRNFGFFVDVPGLAMSGMVPLSMLDDDFYQFDATRAQVVGRRTRRVIRLGDRVEVQVGKVNRFKKQVDFCLAAGTRTTARRGSTPAKPAPPARSAERPPVERPRSDRAPVERPRSERAPMERTRSDRAPVERPRSERAPVERARSDRAPAERPRSDRAPADRTPPDRTRPDRAPVERPRSERAPVDRARSYRAPMERAPAPRPAANVPPRPSRDAGGQRQDSERTPLRTVQRPRLAVSSSSPAPARPAPSRPTPNRPAPLPRPTARPVIPASSATRPPQRPPGTRPTGNESRSPRGQDDPSSRAPRNPAARPVPPPVRPERMERPERSERSERTERRDRSEDPARSNRTDRSERTEPPARPERPAPTERTERPPRRPTELNPRWDLGRDPLPSSSDSQRPPRGRRR